MLFYLSFSGEEGWRGGAFVEAADTIGAIRRSWALRINPGGNVLLAIVSTQDEPTVPPECRDRLMMVAELEAELPHLGPWRSTTASHMVG